MQLCKLSYELPLVPPKTGSLSGTVRKAETLEPKGQDSMYVDLVLLQLDHAVLPQTMKYLYSPGELTKLLDQPGLAYGWGLTGQAGPSTVLRYGEVDIKKQMASCDKAFDVKVDADRMICVTPGAQSVCAGDSGGPLIIASQKNASTIQLLGIAVKVTDTVCQAGVALFLRLDRENVQDWVKAKGAQLELPSPPGIF